MSVFDEGKKKGLKEEEKHLNYLHITQHCHLKSLLFRQSLF